MMQNRELTMDDYLAMLRRRGKLILILAVVGPLSGYLAYLPVKKFYGKYTSQSIVLVEGQKVPESMVQPVVSEDLGARIATMQQHVLSDSSLRPMVQREFQGKTNDQMGEIIDDIRLNMTVTPVPSGVLQTGARRRPGTQTNSGGFYVNYSNSDPREAQRICGDLTTLLISENYKSIQEAASGTSKVLNTGLENAKQILDDMDAKLAEFKRQHSGQLPTDQESNLKMLTTLTQQQDVYTQKQSLAQQNKAYNQSMLSQQLAAWKSTQSSTNPQTLQKQLSDMQAQLLSLQARYTDDHPDVVKARADIQEVKNKLAEINKATSEAGDSSNDKASATEPIEIRQLRQQIHRDDDDIALATRELKRLQQGIAQYQQHLSLSPSVEQQYEQLTRDKENAMKAYQDLLTSKSKADLTVSMTNQQQGESMSLILPATFPESPTFPNFWMFIGLGLAVALSLGISLAMWFELRDNSIRTEADAEAALELPLLVSVPWVGIAAVENKNGKFWHRAKKQDEQNETLSV